MVLEGPPELRQIPEEVMMEVGMRAPMSWSTDITFRLWKDQRRRISLAVARFLEGGMRKTLAKKGA
ncbi:unnamed protein product [Strongylus vulgaris]|uniref:Uncharacterized protein n=1 Tax=Strongylus vulgaris TaxID=40348 RepID=A0A3P7JEC4_STRVU|nr:unnamed protein product [Strongylus vulgaris]